jgi:cytochrome c553
MTNRITHKSFVSIIFLAVALLLITGCDVVPLHMRNQPRYEPLDPSTLWDNGMSSRPLPENTMPRGRWGEIMQDPVYYTGKVSDEEFVQVMPIEVTRDVLLRGQERFNIFCAPCHGEDGNGNGMIVQRGMKQPPSFHDQRLRDQPDGYFYDVITNGFGVMYNYASRIPPDDRWAIVAYVRALQFSQNVNVNDLPADVRQEIESELQ